MRYGHVCIESFGYALPEEAISSDELELRLSPLYERLRLRVGRLELMTGIQERRVWPAGMLPSVASIRSAEKAIQAAEIDRGRIGALIHASVCRDFLEPATACAVHHKLGLPADCLVYDVSNACLGLLSGMLQIANMIELGQIEAGLVVGTESSRQLLETTVAALNADESMTRQSLKPALASLTIGSGSCAVLLTSDRITTTDNRLIAAAGRAHSEHHELCQSHRDEAVGDGMNPLMLTDSEQLMAEGIAAGAGTYRQLLDTTAWSAEEPPRTFCHQVGEAHRRQMLSALQIPLESDFATLRFLGNMGSVALPITMAMGLENNHVASGDRVAMLGIGSGINCIMLASEWRRSLVRSTASAVPAPHFLQARAGLTEPLDKSV